MLAMTNELVNKVDGDDQDASEVEDLLDAFGKEVESFFLGRRDFVNFGQRFLHAVDVTDAFN